ncbi:MAG: DUF882 domain-containing protein [Myxococcales bacterium]|nr:DUF882 domain-containing protein [Myxococcales bacterium]MCB9575763.1 DUF882 domain-containing protein [Polyangiaceae bacterium]
MDVMVATLMRWMFPMLLALAATLSVPSAHAEAKAVRHTIQRGETLSSIAAKYNTNVASICRWNAIKKTAMLTPGKKIGVPLPPGASAPKKSEAKKSGESWQSFKKTPDRPGYVKLVGYTGKWEGYAVGKGGKVIGNAREAFNDVLSSRRTKKEKDIDTRLIQLVAQVSDVFGGRTIHVVSGYRPGTHSKHSTGHALDFTVEGVPNWAVRDYLLTLDLVGVGYYPNSFHVHLDTRDRKTYWVDVSRPGQRAHYVKPARRATHHKKSRRKR